MKKVIITIIVLIIFMFIILLYRTDIINSINNLKCKNIDGSFDLTNYDYKLEFIINVTGNRDNQIIESDKLYVYEENKRIIYSPNKGKKVKFLSLGDQYYRLNKVKKLEKQDLEIVNNYVSNNKVYFSSYKAGDVIISDNKTSKYVCINANKSNDLFEILNKFK